MFITCSISEDTGNYPDVHTKYKDASEAKFLVFRDQLVRLLEVCPECTGRCAVRESERDYGSAATWYRDCSYCGASLSWTSQPMINGRAAGNILIAGSLLHSGNQFSKIERY